jgi:hypothetical protein
MRSFVAAMIFRIIQIVLLPIGAVGYVLLVVKLVRFSRRTGTSATVIDNTPPVRERVAAFLQSCGLSMEEQRNFGPETNDKRAMAGFATAVVPPK